MLPAGVIFWVYLFDLADVIFGDHIENLALVVESEANFFHVDFVLLFLGLHVVISDHCFVVFVIKFLFVVMCKVVWNLELVGFKSVAELENYFEVIIHV